MATLLKAYFCKTMYPIPRGPSRGVGPFDKIVCDRLELIWGGAWQAARAARKVSILVRVTRLYNLGMTRPIVTKFGACLEAR